VNKIVLATPSNQPLPTAKPKNEMIAPSSASLSPSMIAFNQKLLLGIQSRLGIRYSYGSEGPNSYDCSGFVWSVFQEAGISFERTSAHNYWNTFEPVSGDDRFKFGTLVFLNGLGHMGIVADENGFYHASSSKGITYSPFAGYWGKRVVGFRRIPLNRN
jgi:cell wall-associated NlpC family hydrolase